MTTCASGTAPRRAGRAYHAHILTSTRKLGRDGFGEKADPELSDTRRKGLGLGDGASEVARVRELWEISANRHLEQANQAQRIDRRSLKDQGIDREPTVHLGPHATDLERRGVRSDLGDINRRIEAAYLRGIEERRLLAALDRSVIDTRTNLASAVRERDDARKQPPGVKERWVADALADFRTRRERSKASARQPDDPAEKLRAAAEKARKARELVPGREHSEGLEPDRGRKNPPLVPTPGKAKKDPDRER